MKPEESVFADALALPECERPALLDRACGGDAALRARVEALLRAYDGAGADLEASPVADAAEAAQAPPQTASPNVGPGARIGRFKLLQELGEGGCGAVFMAEQEEPLRRRVAIKVIKLGMDTREVIARFEAERQALALMDHPNIAHVLDAGATESGRPYFVMELVRGTPITRHCDEHGVGTAERLQLFTQVCHAVQHAHQKGIIHRDLKPSNILVTMHDGVPVPKIIDFGIAKATQGRLTDKTLFTAFEQFIGTPAYMAPEQAEMSAYDVDTRSDIYSLGVLLYELLTGRTPFEPQELAQAGLDEMRRIIREREPPKPSTRVSTVDRATGLTIAKQRGTEPGKLSALLRGDLDWIVMRCLAKDRTRRYETANGLAMDIRRHLAHETIAARPPGTAYVLRQLVRRNKLAFLAATAVVVSLAAGLAFALAALQRERVARHRADREAARSTHVARFMQDMLTGVGPQAALGRDTKLLRAILDETVVRLNRELRSQPEVEADLREALGQVYRDLGEFSAAALMHERALQLRREFFGSEHAAVANSLHELGDIRARQGRFDEAETLLREALSLREKLFGPEHAATAASRAALAHVRLLQSRAPGESRGEPAPTPEAPVVGKTLRPDFENPSTAGSPTSRGESAPTREAPVVGGALRPDFENPLATGPPTSRDKPAPTPDAMPAVIRIAFTEGVSGGKPRNPTALNTAYQQRALEKEFGAEGIRVEWPVGFDSEGSEFHIGSVADFANIGPVAAVRVQARGHDGRLVMALRRHDSNQVLVVRADSPFASVADLKGRRIVSNRRSWPDLTLWRILARHGFGEPDFEMVSLDSRAATWSTFLADEVDARMLDMDSSLEWEQRQAARILYDPRGDPDNAHIGRLFVAGEFERRYPAIVQRVVTTLVKTAAWLSEETNRAEALNLWANSPEHLAALEQTFADTTIKETVSPLVDEQFLAQLRRDGEDMKRFGFIAADADLSLDGWVEPKYLEHALEELGLGSYWQECDAEGNAISRDKPAPTPATQTVGGALRPDAEGPSATGSPTSRGEPAPTDNTPPAVIRIGYNGGKTGGTPAHANALNTTYQQRALEAEFDDDGIRIEWDFFFEYTAIIEAFARQVADLTNMGHGLVVATRASGLDYKVVMALRRNDAEADLVVRLDSPFHTVPNLRGKRVAIFPGSDYHLTLCRILDRLGMAESDFEIIPLEGPYAVYLTALLTGEVDATLLPRDRMFGPEERRAMRVVFNPGRDPRYTGVGKLCVSAEFERQYPEIVQRVVTTLVKSAAWISDGRNRTAALQSWATSPEDYAVLEETYAGYTLAERMSPLLDDYFLTGLQRDVDDMKRFGMIKTDADMCLAGWVEPKYLQRALEELGLEHYWPERDAKGKVKGGP